MRASIRRYNDNHNHLNINHMQKATRSLCHKQLLVTHIEKVTPNA